MHRATHQLIASHAADKALKVGATAPDFSLNDSDGQAIALADVLRSGPLILTFYRGVWCPYCNMDLQALQSALPEFQKRGAQLVAISELPDTLRSSQRRCGPVRAAVRTSRPPAGLMPARFMIAKNRTIRYAEVNPDYTRRPDPEVILPVLDALVRAAA